MDSTADLYRGHKALPDILRQLDIISDPSIDYGSREHQLHLLVKTDGCNDAETQPQASHIGVPGIGLGGPHTPR